MYPFFKQTGPYSCGMACLKMVAAYYKVSYIPDLLFPNRIESNMMSMQKLNEALGGMGIKSEGVKITLPVLKKISAKTVLILHWDDNHFVVLYKHIESEAGQSIFIVADPACGVMKLKDADMQKHWIHREVPNDSQKHANALLGSALLLESIPK